ncbi:unnamed protein product [Menidia menidia]|uniref:(Atlantic silverside) hypothetical protein n=1 Tax=Menidia menidia TaxID=238744 RepID=A0A8S4BUJ7_9TELE|nr:unnamed protein product [Menidia menidia]
MGSREVLLGSRGVLSRKQGLPVYELVLLNHFFKGGVKPVTSEEINLSGMPPLNRDYTSHCGCLQLESRIIPPASLRSLRLLPQGPHCAQPEVM